MVPRNINSRYNETQTLGGIPAIAGALQHMMNGDQKLANQMTRVLRVPTEVYARATITEDHG